MMKPLLPTLSLLLLVGTGLCQAPAPKALVKHPIDQALRYLFKQVGASQIAKSKTPVLTASRYLVAAAMCHREYGLEDGPVMRPFAEILIRNRSLKGGFFGKNSPDKMLATRWALAALLALDPERYGAEIKMGRQFLGATKAKTQKIKLPFTQQVEEVAEALQGATSEERQKILLGRVLNLIKGQGPDGSWQKPGEDTLTETLDRLVALVALEQILLGHRKVAPAVTLNTWVNRGIEFLISKSEEGKWKLAGGPHPGLTAMCLAAILVKPKSRRCKLEEDVIEKATNYLLSCQDKSGAFSSSGTPVYVTSAAVQALLATDRPDLKPQIAKGMRYLLRMQNVEGQGYNVGDRDFGSLGYGGDNRGDMSNLQMALDALRTAGLAKEDEALQKALVFLQRSQNRANSNDYKGKKREGGKKVPVRPGNDGGGVYYPGNSPAGFIKGADGTLIPRSYGSMTWALLKCYVLCNIERGDPKMAAAWKWIQGHYTLEENPGFTTELQATNQQYQGLFYYYLTMARTLAILEVDRFPIFQRDKTGKLLQDKQGNPQTLIVDWRADLLAKLKAIQKPNGSWCNEKSSRWMEGNADLATAYCLLAAAHALKLPGIVLPEK